MKNKKDTGPKPKPSKERFSNITLRQARIAGLKAGEALLRI
jgi:hypothetical protein